jgi:alanine transaminase
VPGSGFRQEHGTFHFRATFLPQEKDFPDFLRLIKDFHEEFMNEYRD